MNWRINEKIPFIFKQGDSSKIKYSIDKIVPAYEQGASSTSNECDGIYSFFAHYANMPLRHWEIYTSVPFLIQNHQLVLIGNTYGQNSYLKDYLKNIDWESLRASNSNLSIKEIKGWFNKGVIRFYEEGSFIDSLD